MQLINLLIPPNRIIIEPHDLYDDTQPDMVTADVATKIKIL